VGRVDHAEHAGEDARLGRARAGGAALDAVRRLAVALAADGDDLVGVGAAVPVAGVVAGHAVRRAGFGVRARDDAGRGAGRRLVLAGDADAAGPRVERQDRLAAVRAAGVQAGVAGIDRRAGGAGRLDRDRDAAL